MGTQTIELMSAPAPEVLRGNPAAERVYEELSDLEGERLAAFREVVPVTPLIPAGQLVPGYDFYIKNDGAQPGGAYKLRGATNKILAAREAGELVEGVSVASTGNHANATAIAAKALGVAEVEGMCPRDTVLTKKEHMQANGLRLEEYDTLEAALQAAEARGYEPGRLFIHPYDDPAVIAGQATAALEIMGQLVADGVDPYDPATEITLVVPTGGGGLAAGTAVAIAAYYPSVRVVAAQMEGGDGLVKALRHEPVNTDTFDYSCDGAAVPRPGKLALEILRDPRLRAKAMTVSKGEIGAAMDLLANYHAMPEPAGAKAMALALKLARERPANDGKRRVFVPVTTGVNTTVSKVFEFRRAAFERLQADYLQRPVYGLEEVVARHGLGRAARAQRTRVLSSPAWR